MISFGRYGKTVIALITQGIGWASLVVNSPSGPITSTEWILAATAGATAIGVYAVSNAPVSQP